MDDDGDDGDDALSERRCESLATTTMRSIDYLVRGERVRTNARLRAFAETEVCRKMLRDENYASWARRKGKMLRKEIAEAMTTCAFIREELVAMDGSAREELVAMDGSAREELVAMDGSAREEKSIVVFDLCSGKGLTSSVCAETLGKNCEVVMVDSDRKMKLTHLKSERQVVHFALDVYDEALDEMMARARASGARVVVCGVHLCGDLSRRSIELWSRYGDILVLSPCCLVREVRSQKRPHGTFGYGLPKAATRLGGDSYDLWNKLLFAHVPTHVGPFFARVVKRQAVVEDMLSEKNRFIICRRCEDVSVERCEVAVARASV